MTSLPIRIVLVEPSHPGNIGAVARAMKNMALRELWLVRPKQFPDPEATARASGADDLLAAARVVDTVEEALADCGYVAATTSRDRDQNFRMLDVRAAAQRLVLEARSAPAAVLFGAERTGLLNEHLEAAHALIRIPANPEYLSLNIAMAVQLVAYELFRAMQEPVVPELRSAPLATPVEMERMYAHLAQVMEEVGFRDRTQSGTNLMSRIRRFLQRAELDENEVNILRGFLTSIQKRRRRAGSGNVAGAPAGGATSARAAAHAGAADAGAADAGAADAGAADAGAADAEAADAKAADAKAADAKAAGAVATNADAPASSANAVAGASTSNAAPPSASNRAHGKSS